MDSITLFDFGGQSVRVITDEKSDFWFNASDVCSSLGYSNIQDAIQTNVATDDTKLFDAETKGGVQKQKHVNESGLYTLIFGSKKAEAKAFKRWVTSEVLPSIRKTGGYTLPKHQMIRLGFYEAAKHNPKSGISQRDCDYEIAQITGDEATAAKIEREMEKERRWKENTPEGWVEDYFDKVGPGWAETVKVPNHLKVSDVIRHAKKHFKQKNVTLEIEDYGNNNFWYETF